jgi:hypothetical protein
LQASIVAPRIRNFDTVEVLLATGIPSKVYRQILVSFFKNGIVGCSRKRHADLGLMPQIRTLRPHDTHRVQLASFHNVRRFRAVCGSIFVAKVKNRAVGEPFSVAFAALSHCDDVLGEDYAASG